MKKDYIPTRTGLFLQWLATLLTKIASLGAGIGISVTELGLIASKGAAVQTKRATADTKMAEAKAAVNDYEAERKGFSDYLRPIVRRSKSSPGYTTAIGEEIGIEGPEHDPDLANAKAKGEVKELPNNRVEVSFDLLGAEGANVYCFRPNGPVTPPSPIPSSDFVFLGRDTHSPYIDTRPNLTNGPELRIYKLVLVDNDEEVGIESDLMEIKV
jgi:hypothetical protein